MVPFSRFVNCLKIFFSVNSRSQSTAKQRTLQSLMIVAAVYMCTWCVTLIASKTAVLNVYGTGKAIC